MNQEFWETLYGATEEELYLKLQSLSPVEVLTLAHRLKLILEAADATLLPDWDEEER